MERLHTSVEVEIKLISPLHIGSGTELLLDYDLVPSGGRTYRVNENALLEQALAEAQARDQAAVNRVLEGRPASELLTAADLADTSSPLFRYVMPGQPSSTQSGSRVSEQIKDAYDRPYLPGSSLKGALRTVLAWGYYVRHNRSPDLGKLGRWRTWAAQPLERDIFGRDPNRDWLRAVHVEDSAALLPSEVLQLLSVRVYPTARAGRQGGLDVDIEAVGAGTIIHTFLTIDEYGFQPRVASRLGWKGKRAWFDQLPELARQYARDRAEAELDYFGQPGRPSQARQFYTRLLSFIEKLADNEFMLQVGWGAGWESKTLGSDLLRQDDRGFERLLREYRMTKERRRQPGDPFPKSRHLVLDANAQPAVPLGWVRIQIH